VLSPDDLSAAETGAAKTSASTKKAVMKYRSRKNPHFCDSRLSLYRDRAALYFTQEGVILYIPAVIDTPSPFELAAAELRARGIVLMRLPGEYRVNFRNAGDAPARTADPPAPARPAQGKRRRRPLRMTPKAIRRRMIRAHNHRMRALALKKRREDK